MAELLGLIGTLAMVIALGLLCYLYRRGQRAQRAFYEYRREDLAGARILFQSMRDLLEEQKELATQLNENLEGKIALVRKSVDHALGDQIKLRDMVHKLVAELDGSRSDLHSIQRQITCINEPPPAARQACAEPAKPPVKPKPPDEPEIADEPVQAKPWVGLDFADTAAPRTNFNVPDAEPSEPEDPDAARDAFRALLSMEPQKSAPAASHVTPTHTEAPRKGNGNGGATPLQTRIYEYRNAGMTASQIARELGIGKGEVRLILSLRKDKT